MATIKTTDAEVQLFTTSDLYRYDVDNRPLRNLIANDIALNNELEGVRDEVVASRTGIYQTYPTLDARLDDLEIGSGLPIKQVGFSEFQARAAELAARHASGFVSPLTEVYRLSDLTGDWTFGASGSSFPDAGGASFGNLFLRDDSSAQANRLALGTGFGLNLNSGTGVYSFARNAPVPLFLGGMRVQLFNEAGGAATTGPANDVTWNLSAAPASGLRVDLVWLEVWFQNVPRATPVFYPYGAVGSLAATINSAENPALVGTVGFHGGSGGDYFQLQHRLRVTNGVNPELHQFGMSDPLVLARGGAGTAQAGYTFTNGTKGSFAALRDPGIWVAGAGDAPSKSALSSIDGYVYAIPVALVFRRNTAQWTHANQNGTKTSTGAGTWATGDSARPDGYHHDKIEKDDVLLIAPSCVTGKHDLKRIMDESFDRLLRGQLRTRQGYLRYADQYVETNYDSAAEPVAGPVVGALNTISATAVAKSDQFFDENGSQKSTPDDFRRIFGAQSEVEPVGFSLNLQLGAYTPANLVSFGAGTITLKSVGQTVGDLNSIISEAPVLWWAGTNQPVALTGGTWSGLGSGTISAALNTSDTYYSATGTIIGFVKVIFGGTYGGYKKPNLTTVGQTYVDPLLAETPFVGLGLVGADRLLAPSGVFMTAGSVYISDLLAHKVWKLNSTTFAVEASFGVYGVSGADNTHLNEPTQLTVDGSGNVFVADTKNHRLVKLNSSLAYVGQFGVTGVAGTANTSLSQPRGVAVDGAGNVYVSDNLNYRVVKLASDLSYAAQFGVTGVSVSDETHCISPKGVCFGTDGKVYVADGTRVLILSTDMTVSGFIEPGTGAPTTKASSVYGISPIKLKAIRADASGNRYVLGWFDVSGIGAPPGCGGTCVTKYDSSWNFVARYGARYDYNGQLQGGINAGTADGLAEVHGFELDEANGSIVMIEFNANGTGVLPDGSQPTYSQSRAIVLNMADLTLKYGPHYGAKDSGALLPYGPTVGMRFLVNPWPSKPSQLPWPTWQPGALCLDAVNRYAYISSASENEPGGFTNSYARVEKWSAPTDDPAGWTFVDHFGAITYLYTGTGPRWQSWANSSHDSTRVTAIGGQDMGLTMLQDGSALFAADNHTVIKLNVSGTGITYVGRFGVAGVPGNDSTHMNFQQLGTPGSNCALAGIQCLGAGLADSTARVYVGDIVNKRLVILKANSGWNTSGSPAAYSTAYANPYTDAYVWYPVGNSSDGNTLWMRTWDNPTHETWELDVTAQDAPVYVPPGAGATVTTFVPVQLSGLPTGVGNNIMGVAVADGILYWVDYGTNQLVAINLADYRFIGECGTAGIGGSDKANVNGPVAIAALDQRIAVADYRNSRVFRSHRVFAHVQQHIGRVEFLVPPEQTAKWFGYSKHAAYQGVIGKGKPTVTYVPSAPPLAVQYPPISGRAVLMPPEKLLVTTLGRGSVENLQNPGITAYANCIGMLPVPPNCPDEKDVIPQDFKLAALASGSGAHYLLPVLNIESRFYGQFPGENESFWDRKTTVSSQTWGGNGTGLRGGAQSYFANSVSAIQRPPTPLFPVVSTLDCQSAPNYRYLVTPFLVVVEGEVLLAVRVEGAVATKAKNEVGATVSDVIEFFRPIGHPMLKDNGESDAIVTRS